MRICVLFTLFFSVVTNPASAEIYRFGRNSKNPTLTESEVTTVEVSTGFRLNDFDFNIASDPTGTVTPNILSELTWSDIALLQLQTDIRHYKPVHTGFIRGGLVVDVGIQLGTVISGDNQDSDFNGDNRTLEFSRSNNSADSGSAYGGSASLGYKFSFAPKGRRRRNMPSYGITPLIGYEYDWQVYEMTSGVQTIPATGAFGGLDSEYSTQWYGPFVGLELEALGGKHMARLRGEYHKFDYIGEGIWNLRTDFKQDPSFRDEADGDGINLSAKYAYAIDSRYSLTLGLSYEKRSVEDGVSTTFFTNGTESVIRFNEANDESKALKVGLEYVW